MITPFLFILVLPAACVFMEKHAVASNASFIKPVSGAIILRFNARYFDAGGRKRTHCGIDISAPAGSAVKASSGGKIMFAGKTPLGLCATILHPNGVKTTYLPLGRLDVAKGDTVTQGQRLGYLAAAGDLSLKEPHLHMGAVFAGKYINPEDLFSGSFSADFSKLIRRANISPSSAFSGPVSPSAYLARSSFMSIITGLFHDGVDLLSRFWSFLGKSGSYLSGQARYFYRSGAKLFKKYLFGNPMLSGFSSSSFNSRTGFGGFRRYIDISRDLKTIFDPSGDSEGPASRIRILPAGGRTVLSVDVFDENAVPVRHIDSWERTPEGIFWTGDDNSGRIVEVGEYSIVIRAIDGGATVFLAEVQWHLY